MLVNAKTLLQKAHRQQYAVPAFNISNLEVLQGIMEAASEHRSPVIIQTTESAIEYAGMDFLYALVTTAAKKYPVKIALHFDHGKNTKLIKQAIDYGWTSVMFDGSSFPLEENIAKTQEIVRYAHAKGVSVEAELGAIKGTEDKISVSEREAFFTDPTEAVTFVKKTGIDSLAISIGTAHGPFKFEHETVLDFKRLKAIKELTKKPLVLHGASGISATVAKQLHYRCEDLGDCSRIAKAHGVSDGAIRKAIKLGINKINIDSDLRIAFTAGVRTALLKNIDAYDPRDILAPGRDLVRSAVGKKITLFGSAHKS